METDVLIAGAGPIGLTAAIELRRRGIDCRIIDSLTEPVLYAKAVGVQPRTLELFEGMGVLRQILDASTMMHGQIMYVDGAEVGRIDFTLPPDVPYWFVGLPQYETERVLTERLHELSLDIERGVALTSFEQDSDGVTATLSDGSTARARYLIGADGAHSIVRKGLGLSFEGAAFAEAYMLGDVEVDWDLPAGYAVRSTRTASDGTVDGLVAIPLPGRGRYRMSMLVPDELSAPPASGDGIVHGFSGGQAPELRHVQAALDRLSPQPTTASSLRWSSVFRISHRIVDAYGRGRVFVAGDAAHIHPPTGAQGMNTGIQDAHNLAWKIALAVDGVASDDLVDSYDLERRPIGEEVVGMTVRNAREGIGAGETSFETIIRQQAQLLVAYPDSPLVSPGDASSTVVQPGERAPDARGLTRDSVAYPLRLFDLLGRLDHTLILYSDGDADTALIESVADRARAAAHGRLDVYVVTATHVDSVVPVVVDVEGDFARAYGADGSAAFVIRPDGYLGHRESPLSTDGVLKYLGRVFA